MLQLGGMYLHIVICDDIDEDAKVTKCYLCDYFMQHQMAHLQIDIVHNGRELWQQDKIDLLFLDIELNEEFGIALAEEMNRKSPDTLIIFVSGYPFYVTDTYRVDAVQFLLKPLQADSFMRVMDQVIDQYKRKQDYYIRRCEGEPTPIQKSQIVYIEAQKRILKVFMANGKQLQYYGTLGEEAQLLAPYGIVRCHKGFLVNLNYVQRIDRKGILVSIPNLKTHTVPVGESIYETVYIAYLKHMCI